MNQRSTAPIFDLTLGLPAASPCWSYRHPVVFIEQGTTSTNAVRIFIMSNVAEMPQCLLVIYWLCTSFVFLLHLLSNRVQSF